jgi:outer membrane protein assembly factor BamB
MGTGLRERRQGFNQIPLGRETKMKALKLLGLFWLCVLLTTLPAHAQRGPGGGVTSIKLSSTVAPPSTNVQLIGFNFGLREVVNIYMDGYNDNQQIASTKTNLPGHISVSLIIPRMAPPGQYTIRAVGAISGKQASIGFRVHTDWPKFHRDLYNTGRNPYENLLYDYNVSLLIPAWTVTTEGHIENSPAVVWSPLLAKVVVYVGSGVGPAAGKPYGGKLYAVDAATGDEIWTATTSGQILRSSPAVENRVVYVGDTDGKLYAFNADTGAPIWTVTTGAQIDSSPAVANGVVYVGSYDQNLYAFSASTGGKIWSATTGGGIASSPAVVNGVVYVGSGDHNLYAFNASTGTKIWSATTGGGIASSPALDRWGNYVYVGSDDLNLYCFNTSTGAKIWSSSIAGSNPSQGGGYFSSPALDWMGLVYIGSPGNVDNGYLFAFHEENGVQYWSSTTGHIFTSPAVANKVVYVGGTGSDVHSLSAFYSENGNNLFKDTQVFTESSPVVANGMVFVGDAQGILHAYKLGMIE